MTSRGLKVKKGSLLNLSLVVLGTLCLFLFPTSVFTLRGQKQVSVCCLMTPGISNCKDIVCHVYDHALFILALGSPDQTSGHMQSYLSAWSLYIFQLGWALSYLRKEFSYILFYSFRSHFNVVSGQLV